ncbi:MAG TPA: polyphosphate kinase 1 [bacterium]|nr:polyphosphate kinase 1 [bacterium]
MEKERVMELPERDEGEAAAVDLNDPGLYINRELSWLRFDWRVLEEAMNPEAPLLERVKFLSIFANNLDEFFMIRVSGLREQEAAGVSDLTNDGMTPAEQLVEIRRVLLTYLDTLCELWNHDVLPKLGEAGIHILNYNGLGKRQRAQLRNYFEEQIFPVLTPLAFDPSHPWPHISNLSLNLAVVVKGKDKAEKFARLKVPDIFPRFLPVPDDEPGELWQYAAASRGKATSFVRLEEVVAMNLDLLFPGMKITASYPFRITRDADIEIEEDEAADLLSTIEEEIEMRHFGTAVRLEIDDTMPDRIRNILINNLKIAPALVYSTDSILGVADLMALCRIDRPDLKYPAFIPAAPTAISQAPDIFSAIKAQDVLVYHPYDSFNPVVDFIRQAAKDPDVLAIKQTLYRVGPNSPVVSALMEAWQEGKQVAVVVELKARFDEENNIAWARALEKEGVHVIYGLLGLKTHAKVCLVVRREGENVVRYVHLGTGNYNPITARIYTDIGLFTADPAIGADASELFNALTGYSSKEKYRKLLVAPGALADEIIGRIEREIELHQRQGGGRIAFKVNSLVDRKTIKALYRASQAGVKVDLQVRGICCLRPGVPGVSDNITVTSIVGRFLEHSRILYFHNGGQEEVFIGSADLMPRNLYRRVEVMFPVSNPRLKKQVIADILNVHLQDNVQARVLTPDGAYERKQPAPGGPGMDSQQWLLERWGSGA